MHFFIQLKSTCVLSYVLILLFKVYCLKGTSFNFALLLLIKCI